MNLISIRFFIFCIIVIFIYYIVPKKFQWIILLISSTFFLFYNNFHIETVIQASVVLLSSYFSGILIEKNNNNSKNSKLFLIIGIAIILGQLIYLKYTNLFLNTANHIFAFLNLPYKFLMVERNSLIGISYYSLIMIGYITDIYRGVCIAQKNIFKCALFMSYFPILSSGPFIRYEESKDELYGKHKFSYERMCYGLVLILWGIFKILIISQRLGMYVDRVYSNLAIYSGLYTFIAVLFFPLQLYTNFSGSINIIMGVSEILGIQLPQNFTVPFASRTITEFWRNWHITLGSWLRDYVLYPLQKSNFIQNINKTCKNIFGKKVGKRISLYFSLFVMWLLIGIWHGGAYTYIIGSGLLQFLYILLEDILEPIVSKINKKLGINTNTFYYKLYQRIRTYLLFSFAMIFFRATSVSNALKIINSCLVWNPIIHIFMAGLDISDFTVLIISLIILFIVEKIQLKENAIQKLFNKNIFIRWGVLYLLIFSIMIFGCYGPGYNPADFIYRGF